MGGGNKNSIKPQIYKTVFKSTEQLKQLSPDSKQLTEEQYRGRPVTGTGRRLQKPVKD